MIEAYPAKDGAGFYLQDGYPYPNRGGTYTYRERIKAAGGHWNGSKWHVPEESLPVLVDIVVRMRRALIATSCHIAEHETFVSEIDIERGATKRGCGYCDRSRDCSLEVEILEVFG